MAKRTRAADLVVCKESPRRPSRHLARLRELHRPGRGHVAAEQLMDTLIDERGRG